MTTLFNNTAITTAARIDVPVPRKKRTLLPLLTLLFCLSYGLMTMLIVEQGATIESQRSLIRELFRDSTELTIMKQRAQQERVLAGAPSNPSPQTQAPVTQDPSSQVPSNQIPSTQAPSSQHHQEQKQKQQYQMPSRPAADLGDSRRALITI